MPALLPTTLLALLLLVSLHILPLFTPKLANRHLLDIFLASPVADPDRLLFLNMADRLHTQPT